MTKSEDTALREELSMYDDGFPRDDPKWDEKTIVTPRGFLSEIGYDVPGRRIPGQLARHLFDSNTTRHTVTVMRLVASTPEEFRETDDPEDVARFLVTDAYNAVEIYRIDAHDYEGLDSGVIDGYASGGYLVKYSNIMSDEELERTGHDRFGYYWMDTSGQSQLLKKLLEDPTVYGEEAESRRDYLKMDWEHRPNPATGETWRVVPMDGSELSKHLASLARDNLLYPGVEDVYAVPGASADIAARSPC